MRLGAGCDDEALSVLLGDLDFIPGGGESFILHGILHRAGERLSLLGGELLHVVSIDQQNRDQP
ncbi:MAG: hypothetical protein O6768_00530, partial [Planctomycetota bacterium]|nr:hypothetical protein [Planctomycetota bacterium]